MKISRSTRDLMIAMKNNYGIASTLLGEKQRQKQALHETKKYYNVPYRIKRQRNEHDT